MASSRVVTLPYIHDRVRHLELRCSPLGNIHIWQAASVIDCIVNGHLLECPQNCPEKVGKIMQGCWKQQPDERMTMELIHKYIVSLIDNVV
ncbi:YES-like protein [Mya arenaria]|uniref:YES-like protein n=1 Tax=Mya arenaria TaxID=6604 RepID=A0ABY7DQ66_MYAAR|nr:YES-like protein [Mya arenaria]